MLPVMPAANHGWEKKQNTTEQHTKTHQDMCPVQFTYATSKVRNKKLRHTKTIVCRKQAQAWQRRCFATTYLTHEKKSVTMKYT